MPESDPSSSRPAGAPSYEPRNLPVPVPPARNGGENWFIRALRALFGWKPNIARADLQDVLDAIGPGDSGFTPDESRMLRNILGLRERRVGDVMPAPIYFAHKILKVLSEKRRSGQLYDLQPDSKSQVTVRYVDGKPIGCTKVVVSTQHNAQSRNGKKYTPGLIKEMISDAVESALPKGWMPRKPSDFLVNPTGNFVIGGPDGDCGLTGRKIIVDTYGGYAPHARLARAGSSERAARREDRHHSVVARYRHVRRERACTGRSGKGCAG